MRKYLEKTEILAKWTKLADGNRIVKVGKYLLSSSHPATNPSLPCPSVPHSTVLEHLQGW